MVVVEKITKEKITISFSGTVGKKGLSNIKKYIEFLEASSIERRKEVSSAIIKKLSDEINKSAAEKFKKAKGF